MHLLPSSEMVHIIIAWSPMFVILTVILSRTSRTRDGSALSHGIIQLPRPILRSFVQIQGDGGPDALL